MTMPLGSVAPAGGGFGQNGTAQQIHDQVKLRVVSDGSALSAQDASADAAATTAETAQAVRPTPDSAGAVKVDIDPDRPVSDGQISYPITGPDEFARKVGEHTSYELQSAREEAADEAREAADAAERAEQLEKAAAIEARSVKVDESMAVEDSVRAEAPEQPTSSAEASEEAVAGGSDPETPGFG